jgi:hypothetical protein
MIEESQVIPQPGESPAEWRQYNWIALFAGLAAIALAALIGLAGDSKTAVALRVILCSAGAFAVGIGIWLRPAHVGALLIAALAGVLGRFGFPEEWDSGRMLATFGAIVAALAAVLLALPRPYRRAVVVLLVLVHFGGILASTTGPATGNSPPPWTTQVAHVYLYHNYSQFIYLTNAYHFYSPEPGPATQIWFCIYYANGDTRWYKLPRRPEDMTDPLCLEYYRRLSLTMQMENYMPFNQIPAEVLRRRNVMSYGVQRPIPWHPSRLRELQWRPPAQAQRDFIIPSFVRHVAGMKKNQHDNTDIPIKSVKVYHVEHAIVPPQDIGNFGPYDKDTYLPYFVGEFDAEGHQVNVNDPMLYWLVPIFWQPKAMDVPSWHTKKTHPNEFKLIDGVEIHSGSHYEE